MVVGVCLWLSPDVLNNTPGVRLDIAILKLTDKTYFKTHAERLDEAGVIHIKITNT